MDRKYDIRTGGYEGLGYAIVEQTVNDWYDARFFLDTLEERYIQVPAKRTREEELDFLRRKWTGRLKECERAILSSEFELYTGGLDGANNLKEMNNTYVREKYDELYEIFLEKEYRRAIRRSIKFLSTLV